MAENNASSTAAAGGAAPPERVRKAKVTPLPLSQMIPMTFVIVNESLCATMLMPFIGPLVAFLRGVPVNEAGYLSGVMIGMFMLGQVLSAKAWGRISDKYGRRFPIISGLFTSGLMMLGFGLSTNVWLLAVFRFLHGLCNGNVLVAKTMMADITDRTNQGGGFSFMSLCNAFGFLIGPGLGGLLYDPANSKTLSWVGFDKNGFFATHPAFLTSFVVFIYTNIGMLVCTFLVKESNPKAQPLPGFVRYVYPCLWYKSEPFVLPPIQYETDDDEQEQDERNGNDAGNGGRKTGYDARESSHAESSGRTCASPAYKSRSSREEDAGDGLYAPPLHVTHGFHTGGPFSPVDTEDNRRFDHVLVEEHLVVPIGYDHCRAQQQQQLGVRSSSMSGPRLSRENSTTTAAASKNVYEDDEHVAPENAVCLDEDRSKETKWREAGALSTKQDQSGCHDEEAVSQSGGEEEEVTKFGYREAFARPYTRFMLSQYMVLCATDMAVRECFPLWAVATTDAGGLGMTISQVSYILLLNSLPAFVGNYLFRIVERRYTNKMGLFRLGMLVGGTAVLLLPFNSYVPSTVMVYIFVFLCTSVRQVFVSWCYSLNTMLTARSAPPGHVGSIMGINQSCNALVRSFVPFIAAPLFAWSISGDHIFPFNHVLIFVISASIFYSGWWRSYSIRTDTDGNLQMVQ